MLGITVATVSYHVGYAMDALRRVSGMIEKREPSGNNCCHETI